MKTILIACAAMMIGTTAMAGAPNQPAVAPAVIVEDASSSMNDGILAPLFFILIVMTASGRANH